MHVDILEPAKRGYVDLGGFMKTLQKISLYSQHKNCCGLIKREKNFMICQDLLGKLRCL